MTQGKRDNSDIWAYLAIALGAVMVCAALMEPVQASELPRHHTSVRLGCARNVGMALAERGLPGTGSARALSYLHWGTATAPRPGAVAVYRRRGGGHVAVVTRVGAEGVCVANPSRRGWRELCGPIPGLRLVGYRIAGSRVASR